MLRPAVQEVFYQDPLPIFSYFSQQEGAVFLDSAQLRENCGRYSFIAIAPFLTLVSKNGQLTLNDQPVAGTPFEVLAENLAKFPLTYNPGLPPFQGGVVGFFSYDLYQHLENIAGQQIDDIEFPDLAVGFYDLVLAFDHLLQQAWIFSSGYPLQKVAARIARAEKRIAWLQAELEKIPPLPSLSSVTLNEQDIQKNFSAQQYQMAVREVIEYILAGDVFEVNIAQRFKAFLPDNLLPFDVYQRLRLINPAPFAAYLKLSNVIIASASPERFLKLTQRRVEARPIKGTRPRGKTKMQDLQLADELLHSEKDRAENIMIVDLLRNDLSRVCEDHSIHVLQLCSLESYATVHHLVSVITGKLREKLQAVDLLQASFPGGSITGAPKIRAMEIIAKIEPTRRGPYCGSVAYIGFNGDMDSSIVIRTYTIKNNTIIFQAGGAVVADSDLPAEYEEVLMKAQPLYAALLYPPLLLKCDF
jgi:para-aminobenzoate synthetase component 1